MVAEKELGGAYTDSNNTLNKIQLVLYRFLSESVSDSSPRRSRCARKRSGCFLEETTRIGITLLTFFQNHRRLPSRGCAPLALLEYSIRLKAL